MSGSFRDPPCRPSGDLLAPHDEFDVRPPARLGLCDDAKEYRWRRGNGTRSAGTGKTGDARTGCNATQAITASADRAGGLLGDGVAAMVGRMRRGYPSLSLSVVLTVMTMTRDVPTFAECVWALQLTDWIPGYFWSEN